MTPSIYVPPAVKASLMLLQGYEPSTHLAGGAVRDSLLDREVKDWDIFFPFGSRLNNNELDRLFGPSECRVEEGTSYFTWSRTVLTVREHTIDGHKLNLIGLQASHADIRSNLATMDIGICRVGLDPSSWSFVADHWFHDGDNNCELRIVHSVNRDQLFRSMDRAYRLAQKYTGWDIVIDNSLVHLTHPKHILDDEIEL